MERECSWSQTIASKSTPHPGIGQRSIPKHSAGEGELYDCEPARHTFENPRFACKFFEFTT